MERWASVSLPTPVAAGTAATTSQERAFKAHFVSVRMNPALRGRRLMAA